ncbi:MAG: Tad domain-containing protein [Candidatus Desulforudis sp.]|nr:Tad domain-containing protein [Desulforudis sp.]
MLPKRVLRDENGAVLVLVTAMIIVLLGFASFAVDVGAAAVEKRKMQNAADAAALAGGMELPINSSLAQDRAVEYATKNGADSTQVVTSVSEDKSTITVSVGKEHDFRFARVLGFHKVDIKAKAKARVAPATGVLGCIPFVLKDQELEVGQEYKLKLFPPGGGEDNDGNPFVIYLGPGNFGCIDYNNTPEDDDLKDQNFLNNLKYGYPGLINVGDEFKPLTGNRSELTKEGVEYRISEGGDALVVYIPMVTGFPISGASDMFTVVGFAAFEINSSKPPGDGNQSEVHGWFKQYVLPADNDETLKEYGVLGVKLVDIDS